jgi:hypothetical protein
MTMYQQLFDECAEALAKRHDKKVVEGGLMKISQKRPV